jgi:penicillin-binding protein 1A
MGEEAAGARIRFLEGRHDLGQGKSRQADGSGFWTIRGARRRGPPRPHGCGRAGGVRLRLPPGAAPGARAAVLHVRNLQSDPRRHNGFIRRPPAAAGAVMTSSLEAALLWRIKPMREARQSPPAPNRQRRLERGEKRRKMVKFIRFLFVCAVVFAILGCGFVGVTLWYFSRDLPDYRELANYQPPITTQVYAGDGRLLAQYAAQRRIFVPIYAIPDLVKNAFIAAEDKTFYTHHGVDPASILRAALSDISRLREHERPIGASTITQQVAKNMLLTSRVSVTRKIREILLATRIEAALSKDRILELYLNEIYLGSGYYGVAAAAEGYFGKPLDRLTLGEAAFLAGLPKAPNRYNPVRAPELAKARRDWVLGRMVEDGMATPVAAAAAEATPVELHHRRAAGEVHAPYFAEEVRRELLARYGEKALYEGGLSVRTSLDPRLEAETNTALRHGLMAYDHVHGGWRGAIAHLDPRGDWPAALAAVPVPAVVTDVGWRLAVVLKTLPGRAEIGLADRTLGDIPFSDMRWARRRYPKGGLGPWPRGTGDVVRPGDVVMVAPLAAPGECGKAPKKPEPPGTFSLCQVPEVSGALVVLDPHTGRVLALSGGFSFAISQFDRATQAYRQTGSAIKPFVFLTALEDGFTPTTRVSDAPISLPQGPGLPWWTPTNYEANVFRGPTPLRTGLAQSIDTLTVRLATMVGIDPIRKTIERFGILDEVPREYSITLGAGATTPLRLTAAYAMLDNGGKRVVPTLIDRVQDRNGKTIYRADDRPCPDCENVAWRGQPPPVVPDNREQVADPASSYQMVQMMEGVVERGTGTEVKTLDRPVAGKTGTTNDFRDAWFVGFTPDLVAGVYVGYDAPDSLGKDETGGHVAAPIFRDFMMAALENVPPTDFRIPPGLRLYRVNPQTGLPTTGGGPAIWEAYKPGTAPGQAAPGTAGAETASEEEATPDPGAAPADADVSAGAPTPAGAGPAPVAGPGPALPLPPVAHGPGSGTGGLY